MQQQIDRILAPLVVQGVNAGSQKCGMYWQVWIDSHSGARLDGISLANDLKEMYLGQKAREAYQVTRIYVMDPVPEVVEEAPVPIGEMEVPEEIEIPAFLATDPPEVVPAELLDLVRENEAYGDTQTRLWSLYLELNGKLMLGIATESDARLHTRLHGHLAWISKGAAEVV